MVKPFCSPLSNLFRGIEPMARNAAIEVVKNNCSIMK
jgi:hypothetical protein